MVCTAQTLVPLTIVCSYSRSAPQTGRLSCFQVLFLSKWAAVSVEETQKGWVRDPISSGGWASSAPPLKGNMERSTGISWGSRWAILCCSPTAKQPWGLQSATAGLAHTVYFERTLNPAQPPRCLYSHFSCFWSITRTPFSPKLRLLPTTLQKTTLSLPSASLGANVVVDVTFSSANIYPDERAGRISVLLCLYFFPPSTTVTSQIVPR